MTRGLFMFNFRSKEAASPAIDVIGTDVLPPTLNADESSYVKAGWTIVLVGVVGSLIWATFAPLSKGVSVQGVVVVAGNRKQVQHPTGGIVQEILVQEGEHVQAGQVLVRMNDVKSRAEAAAIRAQYLNELAVKARLVAEATHARTITFPSELVANGTAYDPQFEDNVRLQEQLLISRRLALQATIGALRETVAGYSAQLAGAKSTQAKKVAEQSTLADQMAAMRELAGEGYVPRAKVQDLERENARIGAEISTQVGLTGQLASQIAEARLRIAQQQDEYMKEVGTQLTDVQRDTDALRSRLNESEFEVANSQVRSPVEGTVVGVNVFTNGGVVAAGARLMEVVPSGAPLEIEGELSVNLVDKVHEGMPVEIMFAAFNQNTTPRIPGSLISVSADRLTNEHTGAPYYRMRAKVTARGMKLLQHLTVKPGMPVEVFVDAGQRSMLSYLLRPVFDRAHLALTED